MEGIPWKKNQKYKDKIQKNLGCMTNLRVSIADE